MPGKFLFVFIEQLEPYTKKITRDSQLFRKLTILIHDLKEYSNRNDLNWCADFFKLIHDFGVSFDSRVYANATDLKISLSKLARQVWGRLVAHREQLVRFLILMVQEQRGDLTIANAYLEAIDILQRQNVQQHPRVVLLQYCADLKNKLNTCACDEQACRALQVVAQKVVHYCDEENVIWAATQYQWLRDATQSKVMLNSLRAAEITQLCQHLFEVFKDSQPVLLEATFGVGASFMDLHVNVKKVRDMQNQYPHIDQIFWQKVVQVVEKDSYVLLAGYLFSLKEEVRIGKSDNLIIKLMHLLECLELPWIKFSAENFHELFKRVIDIFSEDLVSHQKLAKKLENLWLHLWEKIFGENALALFEAVGDVVVDSGNNKYAVSNFLRFLKMKNSDLHAKVIVEVDRYFADYLPHNGMP